MQFTNVLNPQRSARIRAVLTSLAMVCAGVLVESSPVRAAACGTLTSGSGTSADPWLVQTNADLLTLTTTRCTGPGSQSYFKQTADLTLSSNASITQPDLVRYDGGRNVVTISGVTGFNGLFTGTNGVTITGLVVRAFGSTLADEKGWLADTDTGSTFSFIVTDGDIPMDGGGIVGRGAENTTIEDSYTSGAIGQGAGGLVGADGGRSGRTLTVRRSHTSGEIGYNAGGIAGYQSSGTGSSIVVTSSYSTGDIDGNAGGILGPYWGANNGLVQLSQVFSTGAIVGDGAGGLAGAYLASNASAAGKGLYISNSYTTGAISGANAGGLVGRDSGSIGGILHVSNTYTSGAITGSNSAGLVGYRSTSGGADITILNSYTAGSSSLTTNGYVSDANWTSLTVTSSYSEAANGGSGWSDVRAASVLTGTPSPTYGTQWSSCLTNQPYFLSAFYPRDPCLSSPMATISGAGPNPTSLTVAAPGTYSASSSYNTDPLSYVSLVGAGVSVGGTVCASTTDCRLPDVLQGAGSGATITGSGTVQVMRYDSTSLSATQLGTLTLQRPSTSDGGGATPQPTASPTPTSLPTASATPATVSRITARLTRHGRNGDRVTVRGRTTGLEAGTTLTSRVWPPGKRGVVKGPTATVKADGSYVWVLRADRRISMRLIAPNGARSRKLSG